ncbi:hypothetical protein EYF80_060573 [Liparis tanakae]|uniref:Uncharacterized protein n=1 Tax=Liparis tanakae TaxID=230148 RepID=A0A4Z2EKJ3_9TELE|nr:hypothetical protein EYF80_060573 [Liparis tanakae]
MVLLQSDAIEEPFPVPEAPEGCIVWSQTHRVKSVSANEHNQKNTFDKVSRDEPPPGGRVLRMCGGTQEAVVISVQLQNANRQPARLEGAAALLQLQQTTFS